jgi:hypothetical protein
MHRPISLTLDSGPAMDDAEADVVVTTESAVVDRSTVWDTRIGDGPHEVGRVTAVRRIVSDGNVPVTYLDKATGTLYVAVDTGLTVRPDGTLAVPTLAGMQLYILAHPAPVTVAASEAMVVGGTFNGLTTGIAAAPAAPTSTALSSSNLASGAPYDFSIHAYDAINNRFITTVTASGVTTVSPPLNVSSLVRITEAAFAFETNDPDSGVRVLAGLAARPYAPGKTPADVRSNLLAGTYSDPTGKFEAAHPSGLFASAHTFSNLVYDTPYTAVVLAVDGVTGNVTQCNYEFVTYDAPDILAVREDVALRTRNSLVVGADVAFTVDGGVDLLTVIVPDTPADVEAFLLRNADALGNLTRSNIPVAGTYANYPFGASGLAQGTRYAAIVKVVPLIQPSAYTYEKLSLVTFGISANVIEPPHVEFFYASASFEVIDLGNALNVYAAIHPFADSAAAAASNLIRSGSTAYPHAVAAASANNFSGVVSRPDLAPDTPYRITVVAVDPNDSTKFVYDSVDFRTRPLPVLTLTAGNSTFTTLRAIAGTAGARHNLFLHISSVVIGGNVVYDPVAIASKTVSDSETHIVLGATSNAEHPLFAGLVADTIYGIVAIAAQPINNAVLATVAITMRTNAIPVPPEVDIVNGSAVCSSTSATLSLRARDLDSAYVVYAKVFARAMVPVVGAAVISDVINNHDFVRTFQPGRNYTPFTVTVSGLVESAEYRLVAVAVDSITLIRAHDYEDFQTIDDEDVLDGVEYDGGYRLTWRRDALYRRPARGVHVSNGKIAFRTRLDALGATDVHLSGSFDFNGYGGYTNNLLEAFDAYSIALFDHSLSPHTASFSLSNQTLDLQTGIVTSVGRFSHPDAVVDVEQDVMPLRHMPFCTLHMYRLTPSADADSLRLFHETGNGIGLDAVEYDATTVFHPALSLTLQAFQAKAKVKDSAHRIGSASVYMFDSVTRADHVGFNSFRNKDRAFNAFDLKGLVAGRTYRFAVLTVQATTSDFPFPDRETMRIATHIVGSHAASSSSSDTHAAAVRLRQKHVSVWATAWATAVAVAPRQNITVPDNARFLQVRRALRFAQFSLFSAVRDNGAAELNPLHLTSIDADGNLFWNRELWIVPAFLYSQPRAVRAMLENRYESLRAANTLANAHGSSGAKFPYVHDAASFSAAPYWDVASANYVFNSALVAAAAWDYFRATQDRDWLLSKGYPILSSIADYVASHADLSNGVASFPDVLDANGELVTNPCFTNYVSRMALKAAIEAGYELRYRVPTLWTDVLTGTRIDFYAPPDAEVLKNSASALLSHHLRILEPLFLLHPHYVQDFLLYDVPRSISTDHDTILANYNHYATRMSPGYGDNPFNTLLRMSALANINRTTGTYNVTIESLIRKAIDDGSRDVWGSLAADPRAPYNDLSLSALLVLSLATGCAGLHVSGGVSQSGFYYAPMGVRARPTSYLPDYWQSIAVGAHVLVVNQTQYP